MKSLVLISGKGGTGKTSITGALSVLFKNITVADCDVDAPDLHILLKPKIEEKEIFRGGKLAVIDNDKCCGCGRCRQVCSFGAVEKNFTVDRFLCQGCGVCYWNCPENAVTMLRKESGESYISRIKNGRMVHALLEPGEENSGKLVTEVKKKAEAVAVGSGSGIILIDGPPGIGCPVIASLSGVDFALVVCEPTKSGIHDMKRVIDTAAYFGVPVKVLINKYDLNPENRKKIIKYLETEKIELLAKIPFSDKFNRALKQGKTIIEYDSGCDESMQIKNAVYKIKNVLDI